VGAPSTPSASAVHRVLWRAGRVGVGQHECPYVASSVAMSMAGVPLLAVVPLFPVERHLPSGSTLPTGRSWSASQPSHRATQRGTTALQVTHWIWPGLIRASLGRSAARRAGAWRPGHYVRQSRTRMLNRCGAPQCRGQDRLLSGRARAHSERIGMPSAGAADSTEQERPVAGVLPLGQMALDREEWDDSGQWYARAIASRQNWATVMGIVLAYAQLGQLATARGELATHWRGRCAHGPVAPGSHPDNGGRPTVGEVVDAWAGLRSRTAGRGHRNCAAGGRPENVAAHQEDG